MLNTYKNEGEYLKMTENHFNSLLVLISQDINGTLTEKIPLSERIEMLGMLLNKLGKPILRAAQESSKLTNALKGE